MPVITNLVLDKALQKPKLIWSKLVGIDIRDEYQLAPNILSLVKCFTAHCCAHDYQDSPHTAALL